MKEGAVLADRLSALRRAISDGAPLDEVFDAIVSDTWDLIGHDHIVGLRIVDPSHDDHVLVVASRGIDDETLAQIKRRPITEGVGGAAIKANGLVIFDPYPTHDDAVEVFSRKQLQSAMAAPVREDGRAIGSLTVGSYDDDRQYSVIEQIQLVTLAEHASLAIAAATTAEKMREIARERQMFLAIMTHKLKTPLMVAAGGLELLERGADHFSDEKKAEIIGQSRKSLLEMSNLINKLLKGSRAELSDDVETITLGQLVERATAGFETVRPVLIGTIPDVAVTLNTEAFCQAIGSLLENAAAHSEEGSSILVEGHVGARNLTVAVKNRGAIDEDLDLDELFEPLRQSASSRGIGLGLYIAKRLAVAMSGDVEVHVYPEDGFVSFELVLPLPS